MFRWRIAGAVLATMLMATAISAGEEAKCPWTSEECIKRLTEKLKATGWVGVELQLDEDSGTWKVEKVIPESPAESAGIQPGDELLAINGEALSRSLDELLKRNRDRWKPGQTVTYTIHRDGQDRVLTITLAPMPAHVLARYLGEHMKLHEKEANPQTGEEEK